MKTIKYCFIIACVILLSILSLMAQITEGREFWLTFGNTDTPTPLSTLHNIRIVNGSQSTTGYIYFSALGTTENFTINPFEIFEYSLNEAEKEAVINRVHGISNKSIYIYSEKSVSVYAGVLRAGNGDVTNVLPLSSLNNEHYHISYLTYSGDMQDAYAVIATQNNTQLFHNSILETTLQAGEVFYKPSLTDMTGSRITSNNTVAFFAVHRKAQIPIIGNPTGPSRLFQQLAPVNTWDKTFFIPVTIHIANYVRIVVSQNDTYITQTGGTIRTDVSGAQTTLSNLQAGDFVELIINSADSGCYILSNNPIAICSYLLSNQPDVPSTPAQSWIPGVKQTITEALIAPFQQYTNTGIPYFASHALIVTPTATRDNTKVSISGASPINLNGGVWKSNADASMSYYSMPLTDDLATYSFSNPEGIIIWGYGTMADMTIVSYYYLAYSAMRDLDAYFTANDVHFQDLKDTLFCAGMVNFRAEIEGLTLPTRKE